MRTIAETASTTRLLREVLPVLTLLLLAGCEKDTAQLVQEIDAAREGCTEEMLEAGAEECVQMFEKYIQMGTGAIETYIGAVRAFDAAVDRGPTVRFDTTGLGHAISPELLNPAPSDDQDSQPFGDAASSPHQTPLYAEEARSANGFTRVGPDYQPAYIEEDGRRETTGGAGRGLSEVPDVRRPLAPAPPQAPRRGAILPPAERLERPWIGDGTSQGDYYPDTAPRRDALKRQPDDPKARRPEPSERPPL